MTLIEYTMGDGRKASIELVEQQGGTKVTTLFDAEEENPIELQRAGWQAISDNFKYYTVYVKEMKDAKHGCPTYQAGFYLLV